ncbi:uncharacterized protein F4817DRAFT_45060 [Daldinia loculata]|uniref:uncharacterized protein n=1 Tax=Daldinia loculata TaxID=103429 RepID=UPI0020C4055F|nr:uncharacterized protein F4817DRAFT_45060 [Daldinia loculata]KAI1641657.1 hypothetical protein F4817DRAFT_45060 [Daldinia loculata]
MAEYEARRLENIKRNKALVKDLSLHNSIISSSRGNQKVKDYNPSPAKRRKLYINSPRRSSARIANASMKLPLHKDIQDDSDSSSNRPHKGRAAKPSHDDELASKPSSPEPKLSPDFDSLITKWSSWTLAAPPPTRDDEGNYHFESHPTFTPNKSPEAIIREGSFGGTYWRPLYSRRLRTTITDDWKELPAEWTEGLDVGKYLTSEVVDPGVNKYGVACGQTIEQWEASGWIMHEYDVRGWFQWYCRFWQGRRCPDDNRQVSRWKRCVGEKGRWRKALLKKYVQNGIRSVTDEGEDDQKEEVSPVMHQTCHHWAWEVRQEVLDRFWEECE